MADSRCEVIEWLLGGDPAIRWQVLRDLQGSPAAEVEAERARVAREGWGARLLAAQNADGNWGRGPYSPKWKCTVYTLLLLRDLGMDLRDSRIEAGLEAVLRRGLRDDGGLDLSATTGRAEPCITGMVLSVAARAIPRDGRVGRMLEYIRVEQMTDGGWNCERRRGARHGSVHTTIAVLEALQACGEQTLSARGREFLLRHRLYRSHRTGAVIHPAFTRLFWPHWWHYDILRALDHFRAANAFDARLSDAIAVLEKRRGPEGRWRFSTWPGAVWFHMEPAGAPSRWNTLRALRVLKWWSAREETDDDRSITAASGMG